MKKKILAIGSHFDDIELGCSGTLLRLQKKYDIYLLIISDSEIINPKGKIIRSKAEAYKEFQKAKKILRPKNTNLLGLKTNYLCHEVNLETLIRQHIEEVQPEIIFTHSNNDVHSDHNTVALKTLSAARHVKNLLMYQSNFYLGKSNFSPNFFVDISKNFSKKIKILKTYKGELKRVKNSWLDQLIFQNHLYGKTIGCKYAEGFETIKITY
jgi:N-acetylglucosamine malate deacetylase 1